MAKAKKAEPKLTRVSPGVYRDAKGNLTNSATGKAPDKKAKGKGILTEPPPVKEDKFKGLTADQGAAINQREEADRSLGGTANEMLPQIQQNYSQPFPWESLPPAPNGIDWSNTTPPPNAPDWSGVQPLQGPDTSNLPPGIQTDDWNKWRQEQIDANYNDFSKRMEPQFQRQSEDFEQQMANRGIPMGSPLYNQQKQLLEQSQNDARSSAMVQAGNVAGQNAGQFADVALAARGQGYGETVGNFGMGLQGHQQGMNDVMTQYGAGRTAYGDRMQDTLGRYQANQGAWSDAYNRQALQRGQPLMDFQALYGATSQMPGQNLAFSQGLTSQGQAEANQRWLMQNAPRGGGGGGEAPSAWTKAGFGSYQDMAAWEDARNRANQQWQFQNDPRLQKPYQPSTTESILGSTGSALLGGWAAGGFQNPFK